MDTFAQWMEDALYGPQGYYSSGLAQTGRAGDYFTAPETGEAFGQLLAQIFGAWQKRLGADPFHLVEVGAGEGQLAQIVCRGGRQTSGDQCALTNAIQWKYKAIERSPVRREKITLRGLPLETYPDFSAMVRAHVIDGIIFANELIDAFPVHRIRIKNGKLEEGFVRGASWRPCPDNSTKLQDMEQISIGLNSIPGHGQGRQLPRPLSRTRNARAKLTGLHRLNKPPLAAMKRTVLAPPTIEWSFPSTPHLAAYFDRLKITLPEGYETEVNLAMGDWLREAAAALHRGLIVLIDYGRPAWDYYAEERSGGTLRCFKNHRVMGIQDWAPDGDITADVDFTSLALDARESGLTPLAFMEMGTFLQMGVDVSGARAPTTAQRYLLHPDGLGTQFHVLILGKNIDPKEWVFDHNRLARLGLPA